MTHSDQKKVDGYVQMVSEHANKPLVPLEAQIAAAERELRYRIRVYGRWVEAEKITQATANHELAAMRAIIETLQRVAHGERLL